MQVILKYLAQFLLIPLLKDASAYIVKMIQDYFKSKKKLEDNIEKAKDYEKNPTNDTFSKLP